MTVGALLATLRVRGVELAPVGDRLRYRAPRGALTPELRAEVAPHRAGLLVVAAPLDEPCADRRAPLACGCLNSYGWLFLSDGSWVVRPAAYCRELLDELRWPKLAARAQRGLHLLRDALAAIDALGTTSALGSTSRTR